MLKRWGKNSFFCVGHPFLKTSNHNYLIFKMGFENFESVRKTGKG